MDKLNLLENVIRSLIDNQKRKEECTPISGNEWLEGYDRGCMVTLESMLDIINRIKEINK